MELLRPRRIGVADQIAEVIVTFREFLAILGGGNLTFIGCLNELQEILAGVFQGGFRSFIFAELGEQLALVVEGLGLLKAVTLDLRIPGGKALINIESLVKVAVGLRKLIAAISE